MGSGAVELLAATACTHDRAEHRAPLGWGSCGVVCGCDTAVRRRRGGALASKKARSGPMSGSCAPRRIDAACTRSPRERVHSRSDFSPRTERFSRSDFSPRTAPARPSKLPLGAASSTQMLSLDVAIVARLGGEAEKSSIVAFLCTHGRASGRSSAPARHSGGRRSAT